MSLAFAVTHVLCFCSRKHKGSDSGLVIDFIMCERRTNRINCDEQGTMYSTIKLELLPNLQVIPNIERDDHDVMSCHVN